MEWSPQNAIEAYLQTLHMCKSNTSINNGSKRPLDNQKQGHIEPQGLELISALAAGNQAKLIVHVTTSSKQGVTPLTTALAVAAKQTGGKLICILPTKEKSHIFPNYNNGLDHVLDHGRNVSVSDVVEFRVGDPCEKIRDLRNVDFVVTEFGFDPKRLSVFFEGMHLNPKGAIVVANNVVYREQGVAFVDQVLRGKRGVESSITTIPLGSTRVQVIIRIKSKVCKPQRRRHKRFLVTFDG